MTEGRRAPADLDSCADEPIHIPGSIQPHGVLIAVSEPDLVVRVVSANCADLLAVDADDLLGRPLGDAAGGLRLSDLEDLPRSNHPAERFPVATRLLVEGHERTADAVLHRTDELLVVEIEPLAGPPPSARTYQLTRASISRIHRSRGLDELYQVAVEEVSRLTGFDRVMLYRFDDDWNGEVVAERRADRDLSSFYGLHYPASDIPAQARRLYRSSWLRLIADVDYVPVPLVPEINPRTGRPLDLSHAGLRSVSPVHLEYLHNMGVTASMSVSLIDDGELWGLIACHHYRGPHRPSYEIRAAAEFLGQTLSLRLVETARRESERRLTLSGSTLATLSAAVWDESRPAAVSLTRVAPAPCSTWCRPVAWRCRSRASSPRWASSRQRTRYGPWWPGPGPTATRCGRWPRCPTSWLRSTRSPIARAAHWCCRFLTTSTSSGVGRS